MPHATDPLNAKSAALRAELRETLLRWCPSATLEELTESQTDGRASTGWRWHYAGRISLTVDAAPLRAPKPAHSNAPRKTSIMPPLRVVVAPWSWTFDDDNANELLDLVAAVLFGRARLREACRNGRVCSQTLEIRGQRGWLRARHTTRSWWSLWPNEHRTQRNSIAPPSELVFGRACMLPRAPWVGTLEPNRSPNAATLQVDGVLDLHSFVPKEVGDVVDAYIDACVRDGLTKLRVIHGKGIGALRRTVHARLKRHPAVQGYRLGGHSEGGWGATLVTLRAPLGPFE